MTRISLPCPEHDTISNHISFHLEGVLRRQLHPQGARPACTSTNLPPHDSRPKRCRQGLRPMALWPALKCCLLPTSQLTRMTTQGISPTSFMEERGCHHGCH